MARTITTGSAAAEFKRVPIELRKAQPADVHAQLMQAVADSPLLIDSARHALVGSTVGTVALHGFRITMPDGTMVDKGYAVVEALKHQKGLPSGKQGSDVLLSAGNEYGQLNSVSPQLMKALAAHWGMSLPKGCRVKSVSISCTCRGITLPYETLPFSAEENARYDYDAISQRVVQDKPKSWATTLETARDEAAKPKERGV